jgi:hypothetical protein
MLDGAVGVLPFIEQSIVHHHEIHILVESHGSTSGFPGGRQGSRPVGGRSVGPDSMILDDATVVGCPDMMLGPGNGAM